MIATIMKEVTADRGNRHEAKKSCSKNHGHCRFWPFVWSIKTSKYKGVLRTFEPW